MRAAFTMIEIIFVIVIIGILAAVSVPLLSQNREDAFASACVKEVNIFVGELAGAYVSTPSFQEWKKEKVSDVTNLSTSIDEEDHGIENDGSDLIDGTVITYKCDGDELATFETENINAHYSIVVKLKDKDNIESIAAQKARDILYNSFGSSKKVKVL